MFPSTFTKLFTLLREQYKQFLLKPDFIAYVCVFASEYLHRLQSHT